MRCYNCGCRLSEQDFCTNCGADVTLYKKIMRVSNMYYNEGLEKAGVRDLTGAVTSLRQSLKFNKNNVEARNLLGLVYFEMGEVVAALSEWVISKNLRPQKNIADTYIEMVQSNASRLETINQTIKKYNQALAYCMQDSKDLARIQLKKVLSLNPKFVRAHQLLALLYIDMEQWDKAKRELEKCLKIDAGSTQTLRYLKEVEGMLQPDENSKSPIKRKNDEAVRYQSDNEIIIQPLNVREQKSAGWHTFLYVAIGLVLGVATMYFLILPSSVAAEREKAQEQVRSIGEQLDTKTSTITTMQQQIDSLTEENTKLRTDLEEYVGTDGTLKTVDELLLGAVEYLTTQDAMATASHIENVQEGVNLEDTSDAFKALYQALIDKIGPEVALNYYNTGSDFYDDKDYKQAIDNLTKAVEYDPTNGDAMNVLANAYRFDGQNENAIACYRKVIELLPGTGRATRAQGYIDDLSAE